MSTARRILDFVLKFVIFAGLGIVLAELAGPAHGMDHGFDPASPITKWFEMKMIPPVYEHSCCGKGDGYTVSSYEKRPDGDYDITLSEVDGAAISYPDGTYRRKIVAGTYRVPKDAVNREEDDLDNPFPKSVVWATANEAGELTRVWCFIRHPQGN